MSTNFWYLGKTTQKLEFCYRPRSPKVRKNVEPLTSCIKQLTSPFRRLQKNNEKVLEKGKTLPKN